MKIFIILLFVLSSAQTFLQGLHKWITNNLDLMESLVDDTKEPILVDEFERVYLDGENFIALTNGWLA